MYLTSKTDVYKEYLFSAFFGDNIVPYVRKILSNEYRVGLIRMQCKILFNYFVFETLILTYLPACKLFVKHELYAKKVIKIALNRGFYNYFKNFVKFRFHILIAYFT